MFIATPSAVLRLGEGVATVAGTKSSAPEDKAAPGEGGPLEAARFNRILAIASDVAGNVYVADETDRDSSAIAIRFLNRSDRVQIFYAGTPQELSVAPGTVATILGGRGSPRLIAEAPVLAVAADRLYIGGIAPGASARTIVRVLNPGGQELSAHGVTVAPGAIATIASAARQSRRDVADSSAASALPGLAADDSGNLYLAERANHRVMRLDAAGTSKIFAGTGAPGFNGNNRLASSARLDRPYDVEIGGGGLVYISDAGNAQVRVVDQGGRIRSALGNGLTNQWVCGDGSEEARQVTSTAVSGTPKSLAADESGNVYLTAGLGRVYRLTPSGALYSVAGTPTCDKRGGCGTADDRSRLDAALPGSTTVAEGPAGGVYVLQPTAVAFLNLGPRPVKAHGVRVPAGAMRSVAGAADTTATVQSPAPVSTPGTSIRHDPVLGAVSGPAPGVRSTIPDGGKALTERRIVEYIAVTVDRSGNLIVATTPSVGGGLFAGSGSVRQVDHRGIVTTLLGPGMDAQDGSFDRNRCCAVTADLATDSAGNLYIADSGGAGVLGGRVWFLNRGGHPVVAHGVTVAPGALAAVAGAAEGGSQDEGVRALDAQLSYPKGIALDAIGNLYIADTDENVVQRVDADGMITTVVGTGQPGFNGDGLKGPLSALSKPFDLLIDTCGNLLVADSGNNRVRRLNLTKPCAAGPPPAATPASRGPGAVVVAGGVAAAGLALLGGTLVSRRRHLRRSWRGGASAG